RVPSPFCCSAARPTTGPPPLFPEKFCLPLQDVGSRSAAVAWVRIVLGSAQYPEVAMPDTVTSRSPVLLDAAGAAELVASYGPVSKGAALKDIGRIDVHMRRFIALSPICLVATADTSGKQDVTPRG